nr:tudor domain-containing protein 3 [Ipomoea batatas]GME10245.1 tudor domain-containing protein 3 [Ipomoea batatas]
METSSSTSDTVETVLRTLITRGWSFRDIDQVKLLLSAQASSPTIDSIESELINLDLRSIGGKSLPDSSSLRKISHLRGPLVLQVLHFSFSFSLSSFCACK